MKALPWGDPSVSVVVPTAPMRELVKGITALHRILSPVLRKDQMQVRRGVRSA